MDTNNHNNNLYSIDETSSEKENEFMKNEADHQNNIFRTSDGEK